MFCLFAIYCYLKSSLLSFSLLLDIQLFIFGTTARTCCVERRYSDMLTGCLTASELTVATKQNIMFLPSSVINGFSQLRYYGIKESVSLSLSLLLFLSVSILYMCVCVCVLHACVIKMRNNNAGHYWPTV